MWKPKNDFSVQCLKQLWRKPHNTNQANYPMQREIVFITSLVFMVFICIIIAYEISYHKAISLGNVYLKKRYDPGSY
jgi:hypothetical protein